MSEISLSFPDQTYTDANKPSTNTLKADLGSIELAHNAHEADTDNPHSVTAAQVGAVTTADLDIDGTLAANSDTVVPSQKAIKTYADTHIADTTTHGTTGAIVGISDTQTLTNKRVNPRLTTYASTATPTPVGDSTDMFVITALAEAAEFAAPTGTPVNGQKLIIRVLDNGTARALTWNAIYRGVGVTLPTTTIISKTLYIGFIYNSAASKWDCVGYSQE